MYSAKVKEENAFNTFRGFFFFFHRTESMKLKFLSQSKRGRGKNENLNSSLQETAPNEKQSRGEKVWTEQ
jgi:hypothetical protein